MAKLLEHHDSSFVSLLKSSYPELLPNETSFPVEAIKAAHATTIVSLTFDKGVIIAPSRSRRSPPCANASAKW